MTKPLTQGEKNRRANIRAMKATGARNAKIRAAAKVERFLAHVERNNAAAEQAAAARGARIATHRARNAAAARTAELQRALAKALAGRDAAAITDADVGMPTKTPTAHNDLDRVEYEFLLRAA